MASDDPRLDPTKPRKKRELGGVMAAAFRGVGKLKQRRRQFQMQRLIERTKKRAADIREKRGLRR
jgi:hypothetical protein